jgi:3,4-dihydroxy 2-butanone 4-phosphate synthase
MHLAIRYSSGLIHAAMPTSRLDQLRVPDQSVLTSENSQTSFTVSVDAATGIGTGISAHDRAHTMRVLADPGTVTDDLTRPGHVLPIRCADGGFAERARVWELAVDLVSAAGHSPIAVVCRLVNDSGDLLDDLAANAFALCHDLPLDACPDTADARGYRIFAAGNWPPASSLASAGRRPSLHAPSLKHTFHTSRNQSSRKGS